jgi:ATP-dependent DNA helicase MPH1
MTPSQFARVGAEDSDDKEIERGLRSASVRQPSKPPSLVPSGSSRPSSPDLPLAQNQSVIDICTSAAPSRSPSPSHEVTIRHRHPRSSGNVLASQHVPPSPAKSDSAHEPDAAAAPESYCGSDGGCSDETYISMRSANQARKRTALPGYWRTPRTVREWKAVLPSRGRTSKSLDSDVIAVEDSELEDESPIIFISSPTRPAPHDRPRGLTAISSPSPPVAQRPPRFTSNSPLPIPPRPSRRSRKETPSRRRLIVTRTPTTLTETPPPPVERLPLAIATTASFLPPHLHTPPAKKRRRQKLKVRDTAAAARMNPWIDVEAAHSGDEVSDGSASPSSEAGEEDGSDRRFVTDLPPTQASPSYDQSAVYRQSLLSQAPAGRSFAVPVFAAPPVRRGGGVRGLLRADAAPKASGR